MYEIKLHGQSNGEMKHNTGTPMDSDKSENIKSFSLEFYKGGLW